MMMCRILLSCSVKVTSPILLDIWFRPNLHLAYFFYKVRASLHFHLSHFFLPLITSKVMVCLCLNFFFKFFKFSFPDLENFAVDICIVPLLSVTYECLVVSKFKGAYTSAELVFKKSW